MEPQEYLQSVLDGQKLTEESDEIKALREEREKVEELLRSKFKKSDPTIRYGGSKAKGTMIKESYDLDIICYFSHDDSGAGETVEEVYNSVKGALEAQYRVVPKTSALRLQNKDPQKLGVDFHIDVVPGRFTDAAKEDAYLYQKGGEKSRLKTNLDKHIDHIRKSDLNDIIKLVKLWKIREGLEIKTFVLELLVVKVLAGSEASKAIDSGLKAFWEELRDNISKISIQDPANPTGNDFSKVFGASTKDMLLSAARGALDLIEKKGWEAIFGSVEPVTDAEKVSSIQILRRERPEPVKPWRDSN